MHTRRPERHPLVLLVTLAVTAAACGGASERSSGAGTGGATASGGAATTGAAGPGGTPSGGATLGGAAPTGGSGAGGAAGADGGGGDAPIGGTSSTGGDGTGGAIPLGGADAGGASSSGAATAGGGTPLTGGAAPMGGGGAVTGGALAGGEAGSTASQGGAAAGGNGSGGAATGGGVHGGAASGGADAGGAASSGAGAGGGSTGPCALGASYPAPDLTATPTLVHDGGNNGLFEGVVWLDELGVLLFSDLTWQGSIPPSTIQRLAPPSTVTVLLPSAGTNGLAPAPDGTVIGAAHDVQGLVRIDPVTAERTVWVDNYLGGSFNSPNDLTVRSDGRVYFSDPDFQLGDRRSETGVTGLYTVAPNGTVTLLDDTLDNPNGVALSPDEAWLYVDDEGGSVWRYPLDGAGLAGAREPFATVPGPADGMAMDCAGNLYVASHLQPDGRVNVLAPDGTTLGSVTTAAQTTNLAFGGTEHRTLYVSAGRALYAVALNLPGYPN